MSAKFNRKSLGQQTQGFKRRLKRRQAYSCNRRTHKNGSQTAGITLGVMMCVSKSWSALVHAKRDPNSTSACAETEVTKRPRFGRDRVKSGHNSNIAEVKRLTH